MYQVLRFHLGKLQFETEILISKGTSQAEKIWINV